ncbi:MAG TPA: response regulator [Dehalococcoidia bacterium]|nr:response regulator [Dehalococcoidia bacterium]
MKDRPLIMVVDDDPDMLNLLKDLLWLEGFEVHGTRDSREAIALLDEWHPDLVLLDVVMNELDGFQVLDLIRERSNVPVVMVTGRCESPTLRKALNLGADDYVTKPFSAVELVARIKAKLRRAEQQTASGQYKAA